MSPTCGFCPGPVESSPLSSSPLSSSSSSESQCIAILDGKSVLSLDPWQCHVQTGKSSCTSSTKLFSFSISQLATALNRVPAPERPRQVRPDAVGGVADGGGGRHERARRHLAHHAHPRRAGRHGVAGLKAFGGKSNLTLCGQGILPTSRSSHSPSSSSSRIWTAWVGTSANSRLGSSSSSSSSSSSTSCL